MVTNSQDYKEKLWQIQDTNPTTRAILLPTDEKIFDVDLNTRTIEVPEYLSVEKDHQSETIYFKFDRYFDNVDLTTKVCIIQYQNAAPLDSKGNVSVMEDITVIKDGVETVIQQPEKNSFIYPVPYYDVKTFASQRKVIIPWCIQGAATKYSGKVKFSIKFFKLNELRNIIFELNTLPAEGIVLSGQDWNIEKFDNGNYTLDSDYLAILNEIQELKNSGSLNLYWKIV